MKTAKELIQEIKNNANPEKAAALSRFFKTGAGQYGEGDVFWGLTVPVQRGVVKNFYKEISLQELKKLLPHEVHEVRLTALMIMVEIYRRAKTEEEKLAVVELYLKNLAYVNNWDLVDLTAHRILGDWCLSHGWEELVRLAKTDHLWSQRVAMVSTAAFIDRSRFDAPLRMATILLHHSHDLIHKAVGWMLREIGKKNYEVEYNFLKEHYSTMPRTMLRYAIERFDEPVRQAFLKGSI